MTNMTLSIPNEIKKDMNEFPEINWSVIARQAIIQRILLLKKIKEFSKDSELTEKDALRLGKQVNKALAQKKLKNETYR